MKSIEEKIKEIADKLCTPSSYNANNITFSEINDYINHACKESFKSAFDWISVDDELPKDGCKILCNYGTYIEIYSFWKSGVFGVDEIMSAKSWRYINIEDYENHFK